MLLYFPALAEQFLKAYIHGHYRLNPKTGQRIWIESYSDKRPERHRASFDNTAHRVTHFQHHLARGQTREAMQAFHDLGHADAHQLARHLGLAGEEKGQDKKALMESIYSRVQERKKAAMHDPNAKVEKKPKRAKAPSAEKPAAAGTQHLQEAIARAKLALDISDPRPIAASLGVGGLHEDTEAVRRRLHQWVATMTEAQDDSKPDALTKPKLEPWHTPIPDQGMGVQPGDERAGTGNVPHRAATEAYEAIPRTALEQGLALYLHVLPSTETHHGAARLLPEDQKAPAGWKRESGKAYRPGFKSKDQAIREIQKDLMRSPIMATGESMGWAPKKLVLLGNEKKQKETAAAIKSNDVLYVIAPTGLTPDQIDLNRNVVAVAPAASGMKLAREYAISQGLTDHTHSIYQYMRHGYGDDGTQPHAYEYEIGKPRAAS